MIVGAAFLTSILILGLSIRLFTWVDPPVDNRPPIQVAIIGAGPAGLGIRGVNSSKIERSSTERYGGGASPDSGGGSVYPTMVIFVRSKS